MHARSISALADGVLMKPLDLDLLLTTVHKTLEAHAYGSLRRADPRIGANQAFVLRSSAAGEV